MKNTYKSLFMLDSKTTFLNHGSFGACPRPIFESLINWQHKLELDPVKHLAFDIYDYLENSRNALSKYIHCDKDDLILFPNPSTALNTVIKSLDLKKNDEILSTNHEYGALDRTWSFVCKKTEAKYVKQKIYLPLESKEQFLDSFLSGITKKTKVIFVSHITSATGLIFPVEEICKIAKEKQIFCIIDGAHVPGHIPLNISNLNPDIYVGACHKWMCAPKGVSFLYANKNIQDDIDPLVVSWGYEPEVPGKTQFLDYHQWQGTNDLSAYCTLPEVITFLNENNWEENSKICRENNVIARKLINNFFNQSAISHDSFIGQMSSIKIHCDNPLEMQKILYDDYNIQVPLFAWENETFLRISMQVYNDLEDVEKLINVLEKIY